MKLKLYIFLLAFSCQFMSFGQTLDQSNTSATAAVESLFGGSTQNLSQSFTVGNSGQLSRISVNVDNVTNGPTLYVNCDLIIYNGEGFGGTVLGTYGFAVPDNVSGEFAINFAPIAVTSNQIITFKIVANTTSLGRVTLLTTNDTYSGGVFYNDALQAIATRDLWFKTYVTESAATHLNFGGTTDYVNCGNSPSLQITGTAITLEAYVKFNSFGAASFLGNIINKDEVAIASGYMLRAGGNGVVNFVVANNGWSEIFSPENSVTLNTWHHIAGVYDGVNSKIYVDGIEVVSQPLSITIGNANVNLNIGKDPSYSDRFIDASIDEVRIWNRALPIAEIQNNMNCELPNPSTQNGLVAYYQFNQGFDAVTNTGVTTLADASASGNNGTLTNFALTGTTSNWLAGSPIVTGTNCAVLSSSNFDVASNINVYPNPTNGNINIMVNNLTNVSVSVYDLNGRTILNKELSANENAVDISNFQTGIYLFRIKSTEGETVKKVIKN